jgi:hypothetical protein
MALLLLLLIRLQMALATPGKANYSLPVGEEAPGEGEGEAQGQGEGEGEGQWQGEGEGEGQGEGEGELEGLVSSARPFHHSRRYAGASSEVFYGIYLPLGFLLAVAILITVCARYLHQTLHTVEVSGVQAYPTLNSFSLHRRILWK